MSRRTWTLAESRQWARETVDRVLRECFPTPYRYVVIENEHGTMITDMEAARVIEIRHSFERRSLPHWWSHIDGVRE